MDCIRAIGRFKNRFALALQDVLGVGDVDARLGLVRLSMPLPYSSSDLREGNVLDVTVEWI